MWSVEGPTLIPDAVNVSPFAATIVNVNVEAEQSKLVQTPSRWNVLRPRCVLLDVPSTAKVSGVPSVMIPSPDPEAFHGRSVPLAAASAADPLTATNKSEHTSETNDFRMMCPPYFGCDRDRSQARRRGGIVSQDTLIMPALRSRR
jgi:hypothetical protein